MYNRSATSRSSKLCEVQVRELKAARTLAKFGFGKKRKPTKAKEDAKTLDALDAKIRAVQAEC